MPPAPPARIAWLDGLRGLAALIVLLSHYQQAFLPKDERPLGFLGNGEAAVFLFFLISGLVLTPSFAAGGAAWRVMAGRLVRLGLPVAAAIGVALTLRLLMPDARAVAAAAAGSSVLLDYVPALRPAPVLADASGLTMLVGHAASGLFEAIIPLVPYLRGSLIPPLWSLHYELWGSALVLALVLAQRRGPRAHGLALLAALLLTAGNALVLFVIGHVCAAGLASRVAAWRQAVAAGLVAGGILVCQGHGAVLLAPVMAEVVGLGPLRPYAWFEWDVMLGALLVFLGLLRLPAAQALLATRPVQWLGRVSFAVYLLHWPVLTCVAGLVYAMALPLGTGAALALAFAVGLAVTLALAEAFERLVDQRAIALSRRLRSPVFGSAAAR